MDENGNALHQTKEKKKKKQSDKNVVVLKSENVSILVFCVSDPINRVSCRSKAINPK